MSATATATRETAPAPAPAAASEPRPLGLLRHSLALARRSLIKTARTPEQLLDVTVQPLLFLLMFVYLLGGAVSGSQQDYLQFVLPALLVMNVVFAAMQSGVTLNNDIKKGVFDRFRSLPIARSAPLIGSVLGDVVRYIIPTMIMFVVGGLMGFRVQTDLASALAACLLIIGFAFCVSWVFVLIGMLVREPGAVQGLAFVILFPLTFGTDLLAPTDTLPGWLQAWIAVNPVAAAMDASRALLLGGPAAGPVTQTVLWGLGLLAVFAPLAVAAYRRRT
jgi:oleandomycin transport system permease protein